MYSEPVFNTFKCEIHFVIPSCFQSNNRQLGQLNAKSKPQMVGVKFSGIIVSISMLNTNQCKEYWIKNKHNDFGKFFI